MKLTDKNMMLFNIAGIGLVVFLGGYIINSAIRTETIPQCSARYGDGQQFSLVKPDGSPMGPIEMQARLPTREWGLLSNARVVTDNTSAYLQVALGPHAMEAAVEPSEDPENDAKDGVGFVWQPQNIQAARSACLSYRVYLPKDFLFTQKGTLPGLYGLNEISDLDRTVLESGFVSRLGWEKGGATGVTIKSPLTAGMWIPARTTSWPVNKWVSVEQEVVLNTPDKADGVLRLWLDGQLKVEHKGLNLGAKAGSSLSGVVADMGYVDKSGPAARLTVSPFVVQTQ